MCSINIVQRPSTTLTTLVRAVEPAITSTISAIEPFPTNAESVASIEPFPRVTNYLTLCFVRFRRES